MPTIYMFLGSAIHGLIVLFDKLGIELSPFMWILIIFGGFIIMIIILSFVFHD